MDGMIFVGGSIVLGIIVLFTLAMILAKLYRKASKEIAFVRTGAGGAKVIKDGGALVLPILHQITPVNMNTLKLVVQKKEKDALITYDRMRVDVGVEFFVRVKQDASAIENAAQTLGSKTMDPSSLSALIEGKFVDALRSVASSMTMKDLHEKRSDFVNKVQQVVMSDLEKNGLELESVSLTSFDQTNRQFFNAENAFDAEGLTLLTQEIENRKKIRNDIERDTQLQIAQKDLSTEKQQMEVRQDLETSKLETDKQISFRNATQKAEILKFDAEKNREAETARIEAEKLTEQANIAKDREIKAAKIEVEKELEQKNIEKARLIKEANINQEKSVTLAEQSKSITLAEKSEEEAAARAKAENAKAVQVKAAQEVITIEAVAQAERTKQIEVINAKMLAEKDSVKIIVASQAEAEAASKKAEAILTSAKAESDAEQLRATGIAAKYEAEALGQAKLNDAANKQSPEVINMIIKMKLMELLPSIVRESVKPMENIDKISIVDMGGGFSNLVSSSAEGSSEKEKSLPDQVVSASLRHRAAAPLIDNLLNSVGITDGDVNKAIKENLGLSHNEKKDNNK